MKQEFEACTRVLQKSPISLPRETKTVGTTHARHDNCRSHLLTMQAYVAASVPSATGRGRVEQELLLEQTPDSALELESLPARWQALARRAWPAT